LAGRFAAEEASRRDIRRYGHRMSLSYPGWGCRSRLGSSWVRSRQHPGGYRALRQSSQIRSAITPAYRAQQSTRHTVWRFDHSLLHVLLTQGRRHFEKAMLKAQPLLRQCVSVSPGKWSSRMNGSYPGSQGVLNIALLPTH
jgi:hypothetical protein